MQLRLTELVLLPNTLVSTVFSCFFVYAYLMIHFWSFIECFHLGSFLTLFPQISAVESLILSFDQVDIHPAMTSLIVDEFSHAIDFYRNIIGMRKVYIST